MKRLLSLALVLALALFALCPAASAYAVIQIRYIEAQWLLKAQMYDEAIAIFEELSMYEDSAKYIVYCQSLKSGDEGDYDAAIQGLTQLNDFMESKQNINYYAARALESEGKYADAIAAYAQISLFRDCLERITQIQAIIDNAELRKTQGGAVISAGGVHTVGLKADGTALAVGNNDAGQCDVGDWTDIASISAGMVHTVGLKADGTALAIGNNAAGQCDVGDWSDIASISAGSGHTVGLKADGAALAIGLNEDGQCDVSDWTNINAISVGYYHTLGLKADGTVKAVGWNEFGQCDVSDWTDIVAVCAGGAHTVGLKADGTVIAVGYNQTGQCDVGDWTDIVKICAGAFHTVGLKADGTVEATGDNHYGQCDAGDWADIASISAGYSHTVGLKADGTVKAGGNNEHGQCDVSDWTNMRMPANDLSDLVTRMREAQNALGDADTLPNPDGSLKVRGGVVLGVGPDDIVVNAGDREKFRYYNLGSLAPLEGYGIDYTYDIMSDENEFERCYVPEDSSSDISKIYISGAKRSAESFLEAVVPTDLSNEELDEAFIVYEPAYYVSGGGTLFGGYFQTSIAPGNYDGSYYKYFICYIPAEHGLSVMVFVSANKSAPAELPPDEVMIEAAMGAVDSVTVYR